MQVVKSLELGILFPKGQRNIAPEWLRNAPINNYQSWQIHGTSVKQLCSLPSIASFNGYMTSVHSREKHKKKKKTRPKLFNPNEQHYTTLRYPSFTTDIKHSKKCKVSTTYLNQNETLWPRVTTRWNVPEVTTSSPILTAVTNKGPWVNHEFPKQT